eukprot:scaffold3330_cov128-Isochrysis_galbana.AAC.9
MDPAGVGAHKRRLLQGRLAARGGVRHGRRVAQAERLAADGAVRPANLVEPLLGIRRRAVRLAAGYGQVIVGELHVVGRSLGLQAEHGVRVLGRQRAA